MPLQQRRSIKDHLQPGLRKHKFFSIDDCTDIFQGSVESGTRHTDEILTDNKFSFSSGMMSAGSSKRTFEKGGATFLRQRTKWESQEDLIMKTLHGRQIRFDGIGSDTFAPFPDAPVAHQWL
ncbi:MAG: hypothetical protein U5R30_10450 [Deltaproteobacteria bacterium]|nr:hypothetical protein [Deltaproteobacteria bacterium]